jgi:hypothetical protein
MMEEETLQLTIRHSNELKTDIGTVTAGQEKLKNDMKSEISAVKNDIENSISAVKGNISALETKINSG